MTYISVAKTANKYWDILKKKRTTRVSSVSFFFKKKGLRKIFSFLTKLSTTMKQAKINFSMIVNYSFECFFEISKL